MAVMICAAISGCASGGKRADMDMQGAADRADGILDAVLREVKPRVQWAHGPTSTGSCDVSRMRVVMTIVSENRRGSFLGLVDRFWRKSGYRIKAVNNDVDVPAIYAQTKDGFGVTLSIGGKGQAFFEVDSPCVKESEVAESTTPPNGPAYDDVYPLPRPNVHSDFWSVGAS
ncbi:hypothetical protein [Streptomyces sp. NBC_01637]|uniref:hypothetical protein n=1 Tax=unclassified Streptomyces TaxID=2593676 RepID=UPI00386E2AD1|nr:hypothetical protein OH719_26325 [Streptomyces sp. NBC_01653]WTD89810.1 hypothetical protein OG891_20545 [Streptomyces sp. NBC_01637]